MLKMGIRPNTSISTLPRSSFTKSLTLIIKEKGNTARSKNEDDPVTIIQWKYAETVNGEGNYMSLMISLTMKWMMNTFEKEKEESKLCLTIR